MIIENMYIDNIYKDIYVMPKHIICLRKKITNFVPFGKIIMFNISPGFNQTKIILLTI